MNMQQIMAQAQKMQRDLETKKKEISNTDFTGKSEWFEITCNGDKKIKNIKLLSDDIFDKDNQDVLPDMIMIAINDAFKKVDAEVSKKMGSYGNLGGLL